jgi:hypothetical protein
LTRMIPRLALVATCVVALGGLVAGPAGAQSLPTPTISSTTSITPGSAVLNGSYSPDGIATSYTFLYDTASDWAAGGSNASETPDVFEPAGTSTITATGLAGCFPTSTCGPDGTPLSPGTKYVVILYVNYGTGGTYYTNNVTSSGLGTFTTPKLGKLELTSTKITVTKRTAAVALNCDSGIRCAGKLVVTSRIKHKTVTCISSKFSLRAGKKTTLKASLAGKCASALTKSASLSISGKLTATVTSGQANLKNKTVKLVEATSKKK